MAGQVLVLINKVINERSKGDPLVASTTRTKLLLKGINPVKWTPTAPDDPDMIAKVRAAAKEMGMSI